MLSSRNIFQQNTRGLTWIIHISSCLTSNWESGQRNMWKRQNRINGFSPKGFRSYEHIYYRKFSTWVVDKVKWGEEKENVTTCWSLKKKIDQKLHLVAFELPLAENSQNLLWCGHVRNGGVGEIRQQTSRALRSLRQQLGGVFQIKIAKL